MSISVGGINLPEAVLDSQYRIAVLEKIVEHLMRRMPPGTISDADVKIYQDQVLQDLQARYPSAGINRKTG